MSTILIYTSPARGHLYPMMDVAIALKQEGHRVIVQTLAAEREQVRAAGLEHRNIAPDIEALALTDYRGSGPMAQFRAAFDCWLQRAPHEADDAERTVDELGVDLLVVDANTWGAAAFAEARGRPWAMFLPYALPVPSPVTPAFGPGFAPPRNALERTRDRAVWAGMRLALRDPMNRLNALRKRLGAPALPAYWDLFQRADILLYRTAEPFEYPRRTWPDGLHAIGPGSWAPPGEVPGWIEELPRPRTLVSVSTEFQDDGAIVRTALEALAGEEGSVIVTTAALDPKQFQAPHDRVRITSFLPHAAVIPAVDVVVTHGGMGTTQRALAAGVPVCVIPWGRDQNESARRAVLCGAGTMVPRNKLTAELLREAVREARLRQPGTRRVAEAFASAGGAARAVELLEGLLPRSSDSTPAPARVVTA